MDLTGFDLDQLQAWGIGQPAGTEGQCDPNEIPEPPAEPWVKRGNLFLLGKHRLLCGDSTNPDDVRRLMNGEKAQLCATDPPYLVGYDGTNHPEGKANKDHSATYGFTWDEGDPDDGLWEKVFALAQAEAVVENAAWYCWYASRHHARLEALWERLGLFVHQQIIWDKGYGVLTYSWFSWQHECCLFGWVRPHKPQRVEGAEHRSTVWAFPRPRSAEEMGHPTSKPVELFGIPIQHHLLPGELAYEPFCGSGSQLIAAEQLGRRCYAMEIAPVYVQVAVERWQNFTGRLAELVPAEEG
jgi:DNA modification methylase